MSSLESFDAHCRAAGVEPRIGFVGGGNMASAMARGFVSAGLLHPDQVGVSDPYPKPLEALKSLGVRTTSDNGQLLAEFGRGVTVLAVKPHILPLVLTQTPSLARSPLIVSIVAGATISRIQEQLNNSEAAVVRVMPNTGALVSASASVFARSSNCTDQQATVVQTMMETIGICHEVPENQIDAVCGLSGSGPAYVFTMIDAMSDGGVKMGVPRELATQLAAQTVMGAAKMVLETGRHPGELKNQVCSPGGTTIAGVHCLEEKGLRGAVISAVEAAVKRAGELGAKN